MKNDDTVDYDIYQRAKEFIADHAGDYATWVGCCTAFHQSELARQSGWVKCGERLPTEEGEYIFQRAASYCNEVFDKAYIFEGGIGPNYAASLKRDYVAWQKIEPYQEADDDK